MVESVEQFDDPRGPAKAVLASVRSALVALAAGDYDAKLLSEHADASLVEAFDRIVSTLTWLDHRGSPPVLRETTEAAWIAQSGDDAANFMAILEVETWADAFAEVDLRSQPQTLSALSSRIGQALPDCTLGRAGRTSIEFRFAAADAVSATDRLADLVQRVEQPLSLPDATLSLKAAIGFAEWTSTNTSLSRVVENAQFALARARERHSKIAIFTEQDRADADDRKAMAHDLSRALANDELSMVYQPKLSLRSKAIETAEALIRWNHPTRGQVSPADFIGLAEHSGEIERITRFTIQQAIADQAVLTSRGQIVSLYINFSGQLISNQAFVDWAIATVLVSKASIGFEITETAVIGDPDRALCHMRRIAEAGIPISIDDYGSGLSSLIYLKQFPAKELKIDRAFISELTRSHRDPLIVRSTIDLAHALEMEVTAEGVENAMTLALLQVMGCDNIQGYHFAKPMTLVSFADFLSAHATGAKDLEPTPLLLSRRPK